MLERIDQMLSSKAMTVISAVLFMGIFFGNSFNVAEWIHTSWVTILAWQTGL